MKLFYNVFKTFKLALQLKPTDTIGIVFDKPYSGLAQELKNIFIDKGYKVFLLQIETPPTHSASLDRITEAFIKSCDAVIAPISKSITHSPQIVEAGKKGIKIVTMPGVRLASFTKGAMTADFDLVQRKTKRLRDKIKDFKAFIITYQGFELKIVRGKRPLLGLLGDKYPINLPDGEVYFAPLEGQAEGEFVADFFGEFGTKVYFKIRRGNLVKTKNASKRFLEELRRNPLAANVAEMGVGTNDKALKINDILEAEKILGSVHIAFGSNKSMAGKVEANFHLDGVMLKPTLYGIDRSGKKSLIIKNGKHILL
jgi:leucyl aminopeptidase (aminopeptidase T)